MSTPVLVKREVVRRFIRSPRLKVVLVLSLLLGLAYSFVVPFMSLFGTKEVGMSPFGFGVFMTTTSVSSVALSTWLAAKSDTRLSRRSVLLLGGVTGTLGYLGYAFVRDVYVLTLIGSVLLGISSVTFGQIFAYARDTLEEVEGIEPREIPLYMNVVRTFFALAWTVGPAIAALLVARSFQHAFLAAGALFSLYTVLVWFFVPEVAPSEKSRQAALALPLSLAFRNPALVGHFAAFVLFFACSTMGMMNLPLLLTGELSGGHTEVGIAYAVAPVFELPFMLYVGVLATRMRHERLVFFALVVGVAYYLGLSLARTSLDVYVLQVLSAAIVAVMSGVAITFFQNFLPNQAGTATNLYATASRVGSIAGYLGFGTIASAFGHRHVFLVACGATLAAACIVFTFRHAPRTVPG